MCAWWTVLVISAVITCFIMYEVCVGGNIWKFYSNYGSELFIWKNYGFK